MPRLDGINGYVRWGAEGGLHADASLLIAGLDGILESTESGEKEESGVHTGQTHVQTKKARFRQKGAQHLRRQCSQRSHGHPQLRIGQSCQQRRSPSS